jgi:hypothetical protein
MAPDIYGHLMPDLQREAAKVFVKAMDKVGRGTPYFVDYMVLAITSRRASN